jgi:hypothetical protein
MSYTDRGLFVPYSEKIQAGLSITDCRAAPLYQYNYPQQLYSSFASIPPVVVNSLLFIENRFLLDPRQPLANPAVDWPRFGMAAWSQVAKLLHLPGQSAGQHPGHAAGEIPALARWPDGVRRGEDPPDDFRQRARLSGRAANPRSPAEHRSRLPQQRAAVSRARAR